MTTLAEARQELADVVSSVGLRCSPYLTDSIAAPCAMIGRRSIDPRETMGSTVHTFPMFVRLFVQRSSERAGQITLDEYCAVSGASSVMAALEDENNWTAGVVDYCVVTRIGEETLASQQGGGEYLTVDIDVEVSW